MTIYTQVVRQVKKMSQTEKLALLKVLADSLDQEAPKARRKHTLKSLYGALRPKDGRVPTDDELKRDYSSYLAEKYK
jgi:hypothetical protein